MEMALWGDPARTLDLGRLKDRHPDDVRVWFERYFAVVHAFVRRRVAAFPDLADDVTEDTFLVALSHLHEYDADRGAMLPWLTYIARNCARKALRLLARLLREASHRQPRRAGPGMLRWMRWGGLAAVLFVGSALLTDAPFHPADSRGRATTTENGGAVSAEPSTRVPLVTFAIHLLARETGPGVVEAASAVGGEPVPILPERHVSNADVESARVETVDSRCQVSIRLTHEGTDRLARLTRDHLGDQLALVLDGKVVMTPTIRSELTEGLVLLTGNFSDARCETIARGLSPGH